MPFLRDFVALCDEVEGVLPKSTVRHDTSQLNAHQLLEHFLALSRHASALNSLNCARLAVWMDFQGIAFNHCAPNPSETTISTPDQYRDSAAKIQQLIAYLLFGVVHLGLVMVRV